MFPAVIQEGVRGIGNSFVVWALYQTSIIILEILHYHIPIIFSQLSFLFCLPSHWMAVSLALGYEHLTLCFTHRSRQRRKWSWGNPRKSSVQNWIRIFLISDFFSQKSLDFRFFPPVRGRPGISFTPDLSLHRWKDLVALKCAQSTSAGQNRTGQSTVLFQGLRISWIMNIIPGFTLAAHFGMMVCQCTVADIYCIWLHFNEQRTSCCPPTPPRFSSSPALMIPWVWSSSVEVIFSSGMLVRSCQLQIALLKVQK